MASVASVDIRFIALLQNGRMAVVGGVAIYEAVGHQEVNDISCREALAIAAAFTAVSDGVVHLSRFLSFLQGDHIFTGFANV